MAGKATTTTRDPIGRVGQRRQVVIPRALFEKLRMREGDFVAFTQQNNGILLKPKRVVDADDALSPAEAKKVRHALRQVKQGNTKPWSTVKHELDL